MEVDVITPASKTLVESFVDKQPKDSSVIVQLHSESGEVTGPPLDVPLSINCKQLQLVCNSFLENVSLT